MCTAISYLSGNHYFGRNLDLEHSYIEQVTITPRNYAFEFRKMPKIEKHYALIGMAAIINDYPLYYDATNEYGLCMAGLNFPGNAVYLKPKQGYDNIAPFEFIPWILTQCKTVSETRTMLKKTNLSAITFSNDLPLSPLHWIISDRTESIVVEPMKDGIKIFNNPFGVLTNNPPFEYHMHNLCNYLNLTADEPNNRFSSNATLIPYSRGMGAIGLPGDLSSASRFVRAAFTKLNAVSDGTDAQDISQFFHILASVAQQRGCVKVGNSYERTIYTSCCNTDKCIYYYTTYDNHQITAVQLFKENLDSSVLLSYPLVVTQQIRYEN